jgi:hypothetical protein
MSKSNILTKPVSFFSPSTFEVRTHRMGSLDFLANFSYAEPVKFDVRKDVLGRISNIQQLQNNWDGNGAIVPHESTLMNSRNFVRVLPSAVIEELDKDNVVPTPYGTVVLDWERNGDLVSVEIGESKLGFFSESRGKESLKISEANFNANALPSELNSAFQIFFRKNMD